MYRDFIQLNCCILFFGLSLFSQQTEGKFFLKGKIEGVDNRLIYLSYYDDNSSIGRLDSSIIKSGYFSFTGKINQPAVAFIKLNRKEAIGLNATNIFLEPANMCIDLKLNDFRNAHLTGSNTQTDYEELRCKGDKIIKNHPLLFDSIGYVQKNLDQSLYEKLSIVNDSLDMIDYEYFDQHPKSYLTAYLLQTHARKLSPDSLAIFYNRLNDSLKQHPVTQTIRTSIINSKAGSVGSVAPSFIAKDTSGNDFYFSLLKGEYILLDFWASWCVPCRENNPYLIELFNKYKSKGLKIVGIADERNLSQWKEAIKKEKIHIWIHVRRQADIALKSMGLTDPGDINEQFNVSLLPAYILIDKYGVIIDRFESNEDSIKKLQLKLELLFKEK